MTFAIFWLLFAVAAGVYAGNRGRSGFGWFLISALISPLLGILFIAVSKDLSKAPAAAAPHHDTHLKCPSCAEWVLPEASKCKHCGEALTPQPDYARKKAVAAARNDNRDLAIGLLIVILVVGIVAFFSTLR